LHRSPPIIIEDSAEEEEEEFPSEEGNYEADDRSSLEASGGPRTCQRQVRRSLSVPLPSEEVQGRRGENEVYTVEVLRQAWQQNLDAAATEIRKLQGELQLKEGQLRRYETDLLRSNAHVAELQSAQKQRIDNKEAQLEALILSKDQYIKQKRKELKDRETLGTFTRLLPTSREWFAKINMKSGFLEIYAESKQVLYHHNSRRPFYIPSFSQNETLRLLCCKGLGLDPDTIRVPLEHVRLNLLKLSPQAITRALITSALREWVFQTDFPRLDEVPSELLMKYREHLLAQGSQIEYARSKYSC
jgi:hypothetical protein